MMDGGLEGKNSKGTVKEATKYRTQAYIESGRGGINQGKKMIELHKKEWESNSVSNISNYINISYTYNKATYRNKICFTLY